MSAAEDWRVVAPAEWRAISKAYPRVIPLDGKHPALAGTNWRELVVNDDDVRSFGQAGWNIGVAAGEVLFFDFDTADDDHAAAELVQLCREVVEVQLGQTLGRGRSNSPRIALVYHQPVDPLRRKRTLRWKDAEGKERLKLELLTFGQYLLFAGVHPSRVMLTYQAPPGIGPHSSYQDLPKVTEADTARAVEALTNRLDSYGLILVSDTQAGGDSGTAIAVTDPRLLASNLERLRDAMLAIPNDRLDRGEWVADLHFIKGACGGDEVFYESVVAPWCLRWKEAPAEAVLAEARRVWDSIKDVKWGADRLEAEARRYGYKGPPLRNDLVAFPGGGTVAKQPDDDDWLALPATPQAPPAGLLDTPSDDRTLALRFQDDGKAARFLYDPTLGRAGLWRWYDGKRWTYAGSSGQDKLRDAMGLWLSQFGSKLVGRTEAVEKFLRAHRFGWPGDFDHDLTLINRPDGTTRIIDGAFRHLRHDPEHRLTRLTGVGLGDPNQTAIFDHWLAGWSDGNPEIARTMEELLARGFAAEAPGEFIFNLTGHTNNGKTLFVQLARTLYGEYAHAVNPASFSAKGIPHGSQHRSDLVALLGKRLLTAVEPANIELDQELLKAMSGGDPIPIRMAHTGQVLEVRFGMLWIISNHTLRMVKVDAALERRLFVVPFTRTFERDAGTKARMVREFVDHGPHILARLLAVAARTGGAVYEPAGVRLATQSMLDDMDQRRAVCREAFVLSPMDRITVPALCGAYRDAAQKLGMEAEFMSDEVLSRELSDVLGSLGATRDRWYENKSQVRGYRGLRARGWLD